MSTKSQVITYTNFSKCLTDTITANIANNATFNNSLKTITGAGVVWDASALMISSGTPTLNLVYINPNSTPNGGLFSNSNYAFGDPSQTNVVGYEYYQINSDSLVSWGYYAPSTAHEIFQNPDKRLIFPFNLNQTYTDTYYKTNYSNWNTFSSYQYGVRTVTYSGYGTLILPQGSIEDVALISEIRTNNLGPDSYTYTWYNVNNGKMLLLREENNGDIKTVWCSSSILEIIEARKFAEINIYPNPINTDAYFIVPEALIKENQATTLKIFSILGEEIKSIPIYNSETLLEKESLKPGCYLYLLYNSKKLLCSGKLSVI
ncbi:MAG: hypothetical protein HND27_10075 [Bacteroidetes bacterium]|nr:hypothetical protein [Flavobacteriales bacterium]NOG96108.1 hypothetical protein [Bacteroidota bacterium]WKZ75207.1 MAG: hypothetical protein QY303_13785 [Vicingaceae bacterium]